MKKMLAYIVLLPMMIMLLPVLLVASLFWVGDKLGTLHDWAMKEVGWK